ncbi:MAG TPA: AmmeMemoRadiSam system protein B [Draconibacterium sp.]|nr:AmmeMemoRadiSam system protein B [Draconibacterium sp.]
MKSWPTNDNTREAQFAGQFYPGNKTELTNQLIEFFEQAKNLTTIQTRNKPLQALIVPHAGYVFSGKVAAAAFHQIPENAVYTRVFVLASSHRYSFNGAAVLCNGNYKTLLGEIKVDTQLSKELVKISDLFIEHPDAHENEHSLEVQLPFLQHKLGNNFLLVPIILGTHEPEICKKIAQKLKLWFTDENLWVISSDFSHYPEYDNAYKVDELTATAICSNQPEKLQSVLKENKKLQIGNLATSLCGWTSVLTLLNITEKQDYIYEKILYQNSGDAKIYGSKNRVVGYWAIAVYRQKKTFSISQEERKELLEKARNSITTFVNNGKESKPVPPFSSGILNDIMGAFVSIYVNGKLRGCIGGFAQEKSLNDVVQHMAVSASCDRRFTAVQPEELENMELEISVLSPLKKIESINEIELGKHGIYIKKDISSGTFLPQVATKTGWNLEEFLGHCSRDKAGIGWDGWKTADIFTYEAVVFREQQPSI